MPNGSVKISTVTPTTFFIISATKNDLAFPHTCNMFSVIVCRGYHINAKHRIVSSFAVYIHLSVIKSDIIGVAIVATPSDSGSVTNAVSFINDRKVSVNF